MKSTVTILGFLLFLSLPFEDISAQNTSSRPEFFSTFRPVFTTVQTRSRTDASTSTTNALNARLHLGMNYQINEDLRFRTRVAGRYATNQDDFDFPLQGHTGGGGSYSSGTTTIDEFNLAWKIQPNLELVAGRFQGRFPLAGFIPKGMDRYYAANLSISHTDGLWLKWNLSPTWKLDFIANHNSSKGSSHAARTPMDFSPDPSRFSGYVNLAHRNTSGLWVQREIGLSFYPSSFQRDGSRQNLTVLTGRAMMRVPVEIGIGELWAGGELGFIPSSPRATDAGTLLAADTPLFETSSVAWQVSAYANDVLEKHTFGLLYGQTEPHWVISSSFSTNQTMAEARYKYTFSSRLNFEIRYRFRTDLYKPITANYTQQQKDLYARFTVRF